MGLDILLVVACALIDADGRVLLAKRPPGGGRSRDSGSFRAAKSSRARHPMRLLIRELEEELAIRVTPKCLAPFTFASHSYEAFHLLMPLYFVSQVRGW